MQRSRRDRRIEEIIIGRKTNPVKRIERRPRSGIEEHSTARPNNSSLPGPFLAHQGRPKTRRESKPTRVPKWSAPGRQLNVAGWYHVAQNRVSILSMLSSRGRVHVPPQASERFSIGETFHSSSANAENSSRIGLVGKLLVITRSDAALVTIDSRVKKSARTERPAGVRLAATRRWSIPIFK